MTPYSATHAARSTLARDVAERFYGSILRRARKLLRDGEAAKDVAQDVLVRVMTSGPPGFDVHPSTDRRSSASAIRSGRG